MTYLQLINGVLTRLRETTVDDLSESYTLLIGAFVNDAKRQVEDAWNWSALVHTFDVTTVNGTASYALTDSQNRSIIEDVTNDTSASYLTQKSRQWLRKALLGNPTLTSTPASYIIGGTNASGDQLVDIYPTPDDTYLLSFNGFKKQADLSDIADVIDVPYTPVLELAFALAARERGEVGGQTALELFGIAKRTLSDAIAYDAQLAPADLIFEEV